ncbi:hypothetical protein ABT354_01270 [Streptomyces sp. NPDC000594]
MLVCDPLLVGVAALGAWQSDGVDEHQREHGALSLVERSDVGGAE